MVDELLELAAVAPHGVTLPSPSVASAVGWPVAVVAASEASQWLEILKDAVEAYGQQVIAAPAVGSEG
jgi:hypothetical protein